MKFVKPINMNTYAKMDPYMWKMCHYGSNKESEVSQGYYRLGRCHESPDLCCVAARSRRLNIFAINEIRQLYKLSLNVCIHSRVTRANLFINITLQGSSFPVSLHMSVWIEINGHSFGCFFARYYIHNDMFSMFKYSSKILS